LDLDWRLRDVHPLPLVLLFRVRLIAAAGDLHDHARRSVVCRRTSERDAGRRRAAHLSGWRLRGLIALFIGITVATRHRETIVLLGRYRQVLGPQDAGEVNIRRLGI